ARAAEQAERAARRAADQLEQVALARAAGAAAQLGDAPRRRPIARRLRGFRFLGEAAQHGLSRAAAGDARRAGSGALRREAPAQFLLLAPPLLLVARLDLPDLPVALAPDVVRLPPGGLLRQREIQADGGQIAESAHQLTFTSVVAESSAQGSGVSCWMRQGGCSAPRRQPRARTARSPVNGAGLLSVGPPPTVCSGSSRRPSPVSMCTLWVSNRRSDTRTGRYRGSRPAARPAPNVAGIGSITCS